VAVGPSALEDLVTASVDFDDAFWRGRRVLITGHTGFKGGWLSLRLALAGARLHGYSLAPPTRPSLYEEAMLSKVFEHSEIADIREAGATREAFVRAKPEVVFHLAAQSLVRTGYREPICTFASNVLGTAHVLEAVRCAGSARVVVVATTDKVYRHGKHDRVFCEDDALGGDDPYSASKAASEMVIESYRRSYLEPLGVAVASARAGNVVGGGDWSTDRLIPDAVRAWSGAQPLVLRYPSAVRPWQHVLEPVTAYLRMARRLWEAPNLSGAYNVGPKGQAASTVSEVVAMAQRSFGSGAVEMNKAPREMPEANYLALDPTRVNEAFGVRPRWHLEATILRTMTWYRRHAQGSPARDLCEADIAEYERG
jgi:CDP-glucose 4,6-dehydratase